jgi:hypothetical protein
MSNQMGVFQRITYNSAIQPGRKTIKMDDELQNTKIDNIDRLKIPSCLVFTHSQTETMAVGRLGMDGTGTSMFCSPFVSGLCSELNYVMPRAITVLH